MTTKPLDHLWRSGKLTSTPLTHGHLLSSQGSSIARVFCLSAPTFAATTASLHTAGANSLNSLRMAWKTQHNTVPYVPVSHILPRALISKRTSVQSTSLASRSASMTHPRSRSVSSTSSLPCPNFTQGYLIGVTNNALTSQVASGILSGLFPALSSRSPSPAVLIQPPTLDSLEPTYPCPAADTLRNAYTTGSDAWLKHLGEAKSLFGRLDAISGLQGVDGWHVSFDQ